jgi:hypothetical protein
MVNYAKSVIYKIVCKDINITDCYVGSTANDLRRRKSEHKSRCKNYNLKKNSLKIYNFINDNGNFDNWDIIEIERYEAIDKQDLHKRERYYIELLGANLNQLIPTRTLKENYEENRDKMKIYEKDYREKNQDKIKQKKKEDYEKNKDKINIKSKEDYERNKDKIKKNREENKDKINKKKREHYEKNKDEINKKQNEKREEKREEFNNKAKEYYEKNKERVKCDICNKEMNKTSLLIHKKKLHN